MILILSGTNRPKSKTRIIAQQVYDQVLSQSNGEEVVLYSLEDMPVDVLNDSMYMAANQNKVLTEIQDQLIIPATKWIIVCPEYNGSFPGILKLFIDALSIRKYAETFKGKKVALIGVSSGRAGNLRGMEHLTGLLNYLGMYVFPSKLPISSIESAMDTENNLNEETKNALLSLTQSFINQN